MEKRSRKYQKLYKDELGAYYCARPMMAKEIAGNARAFLPIFIGFLLFMVIGGLWYFIEYVWKGKTDPNRDLSLVILYLLVCGMTIFYFIRCTVMKEPSAYSGTRISALKDIFIRIK